MPRLPQPGQDNGTWGDILNEYLLQTHKNDGTLKDNAVTSNTIAPNSITNAAIASDAINSTSIADGSITEPLLDTIVQGKLNATAPTWSTLAGKPAVIAAGADSAAAKAALLLAKTDVGLGSVDNTSDANKPISTATQTALNGKADNGAVVHTTGNESISGTKTFTSKPIVTHIEVQPASVGGSASMFLNNNNGQTWEFFGNNGGSFGVYDQTSAKQPMTIDPNSPSDSLKLSPAGVAINTQLTMGSNKIVNVTDPTAGQDVATKNYVDNGTATLTNKRVIRRVTSITSSATPTINTDNCETVTITALATAITSMTTNLSGTPTLSQKLMIYIKDDGTARAITWGSAFEPTDNAALITTTVVGKTHIVGFMYDSVQGKWKCVAVNSY